MTALYHSFSWLLQSQEQNATQSTLWLKALSVELLSVDSDIQSKTYAIVIAKKLEIKDDGDHE